MDRHVSFGQEVLNRALDLFGEVMGVLEGLASIDQDHEVDEKRRPGMPRPDVAASAHAGHAADRPRDLFS